MIKAGLFDVGGVLHKNTLFSAGSLSHFDFTEKDFNDNFVHKDVLEIVRALKDQDIRLGILSNTQDDHALYLTQMGMYDEFDELIFSYKVNVRKPDPKIYHHALEKLDVSAEETFYIDDLQENVDAARALGMYGIVYTSAQDLRNELQRIGVKI
jgi:epoxide hydrolase-like predicted phosphatase